MSHSSELPPSDWVWQQLVEARAERDRARAIAVQLEQENAFLLADSAALYRSLTECQQRANDWYMDAHSLGGA